MRAIRRNVIGSLAIKAVFVARGLATLATAVVADMGMSPARRTGAELDPVWTPSASGCEFQNDKSPGLPGLSSNRRGRT
jgi:hypothetical protein